jgi:hypothetical protein
MALPISCGRCGSQVRLDAYDNTSPPLFRYHCDCGALVVALQCAPAGTWGTANTSLDSSAITWANTVTKDKGDTLVCGTGGPYITPTGG